MHCDKITPTHPPPQQTNHHALSGSSWRRAVCVFGWPCIGGEVGRLTTYRLYISPLQSCVRFTLPCHCSPDALYMQQWPGITPKLPALCDIGSPVFVLIRSNFHGAPAFPDLPDAKIACTPVFSKSPRVY